MSLIVESDNIKYTEDFIEAIYEYQSTNVEKIGSKLKVIVCTNFSCNFCYFNV